MLETRSTLQTHFILDKAPPFLSIKGYAIIFLHQRLGVAPVKCLVPRAFYQLTYARSQAYARPGVSYALPTDYNQLRFTFNRQEIPAGGSMTPRPLRQLFDAMYHGKYRFEEFLELRPQEHYNIVRWNSRTIYKPSKKLKAFHYFLNGFLLEYLPVNQSVSFAYRKGATLQQAVAPHARSRAFYQTDLQRFFDSITSDLIRSTLEGASTPASDLPEHIDHILDLLTINGKLPIGYSTSPILSNACLLRFDERLAAISKDRQWIYTRYADDIIISADDRKTIGDAKELIESCLAAELGGNFALNPSKSKLTTIGRKVKLLGLVILPNGAVAIDRDIRNRIETLLHFYISDRSRLAKIFEEERSEGMEEGLQRLSGLVSYTYAADPLYLEKLRAKFGATVIDSLLHRSAE